MKGFDNKKKSEKKIIKNTRNNNFKAKIIRKAFNFHAKGDIAKAIKYYKYFINQGFVDNKVFLNYGALLKDLGKITEAELFIRKAIKLDPNFAMSHSNFGVILKDLGKLEEAEISLRKAIELNPKFTDAYVNLGGILRDLGKLEEAELFIQKAIELNPNSSDAYVNLGGILRDLGKLEEAEISLKKAIELNPKFTDAYLYLGGVLRDLGKLEELILISQTIIETKFLNKGYKLRALINIAIGNLLLKNFSETFFNINKTNKLISEGALNLIQDAQNRKHISAFSRFISSLYPLLQKNSDHNHLKRIPHFGESHCLCFAHQMVSISSQFNQIQPVLITGAKAWHFASSEMNKWKDSLNKQVKKHTYSDIVFISFGEIDCRKDEGIVPYALKSNKDILEVCNDTVDGFVNYMEIILSPHYSQRYYFGIPAPSIKEVTDELDYKRMETIKIYNSFLKKKILSCGSYFVDVYKLTSSANGINNNIHMCDKTHLSPESISILFNDYLRKP